MGPGVSQLCMWYFYHAIEVGHDFPPPIVLFWIIHLLIKYFTFLSFPPPTLLKWVSALLCLDIRLVGIWSIIERFSLSLSLSLAALTTTLLSIQPPATALLAGTMLLRLFTTHTCLCINCVLQPQAFFWVLEHWQWD